MKIFLQMFKLCEYLRCSSEFFLVRESYERYKKGYREKTGYLYRKYSEEQFCIFLLRKINT